jgi:hypothetical protein
MLKFLNRTIGRAGRGANPRVRQFLEQERSFGKAAPARAGRHDLKHPHLPLQRDRQDIAGSDALSRGFDPPRIETHMALGDKPRREAPGSRHTREPQPFVEPLPQRHAFPYVIPDASINIPWKGDFKRRTPFGRRHGIGGGLGEASQRLPQNFDERCFHVAQNKQTVL